MTWTRREFGASVIAVPSLLTTLSWAQVAQAPAAASAPAQNTTRPPRPPALAPELVREFVGAAHGDLDKTKKMLAEQPGLLNAVWDWGGGDFEAAIGGAGHMGRADIANFLISRGGRMDIFVGAMLGQLQVVQAMIASNPAMQRSLGPHGIPLRRHAEMGLKNGVAAAEEVMKWLDGRK